MQQWCSLLRSDTLRVYDAKPFEQCFQRSALAYMRKIRLRDQVSYKRSSEEPLGCASTSLRPTLRMISTSCSMLEKRAFDITCRNTSKVSSAVAREPTTCLKTNVTPSRTKPWKPLTVFVALKPDSRRLADWHHLGSLAPWRKPIFNGRGVRVREDKDPIWQSSRSFDRRHVQ
jgi:hypothetical protein